MAHATLPAFELSGLRANVRQRGRSTLRLSLHPSHMTVDVHAESHVAAGEVYRPFFLSAIVVMLTVGATWGAVLLWQIALARQFMSLSVQSVNAHGSAQIFGWVGLFIMGFAYQAFPRMWKTTLAAPRLAKLVLVLTLAAISFNTLGVALRQVWQPAVGVAVAAAALHVVAILIFVAQLLHTFRHSGQRFDPFAGFVFVACFWFVAMSVMNAWHTFTTLTAPGMAELVWHVATYQAPLRDMQVHGLALTMALGVSLRVFPSMFGLPKTPTRRAWLALALITAAVVMECIVFVAYRWSGNHVIAAFLTISWLMLAGAVAWLVIPWQLWRPLPFAGRSNKFVRSAYGWLGVSLVMLLLLPVYTHAVGVPFSHAYYGAIRHAITVGFLSQMIIAVSSNVTPRLRGIDEAILSDLRGPFLLANAGCALRVAGQVLTDTVPTVYSIFAFSGILEVAAFLWWAITIMAVLRPVASTRAPTMAKSI